MSFNLPHISRKWMIFTVTANGTFMASLSAGVVNVALPTMAEEFGVSLEDIQLVVSFYLLLLTCFLPLFGKLSDLFSRKWIYLGGFVAFGVGAFLCALSNSLPMILFARAIQGIGASAMMGTSQALVASVFHGKSRGQAFGGVGAVVAGGSLAGPAIGGVLIQAFGWKSIFWLAIPLALIGIWRGIYLIPRFKVRKRAKMDYGGTLLYLVTSFSFLYALNTAAKRGWTDPFIVGSFVTAAVFFFFFIRREKKVKDPFLDFSVFKIPAISFGCLVTFLGYTAQLTNSILLPFYLTDIMGMDPIKIGMLILPFPIMLAVASTIAGNLNAKIPARILSTVGLCIGATGTLLFAFIGKNPSVFYILFAQMVMGLGSGTFQVPNNNTVVSAAPKGKLGVVASINALSRNVGMITGIALSVAIFSLAQKILLSGGTDTVTSFIRAYQYAMFFGTICAVTGAVFSSKR